ncbi:carboxypeptidase [Perilla frutescens var. hirtella]|uniref:Carboxypeptidase n=1 Tax=Perilla frutescens var. hirtella TaxID=608512 RepID=A0AAD4ISJ1_PERFH|nr:carboxypeptidase [Perilla frutescens var. frutescens]KAH6820371.1 carboxypeptidase [Perilla frutescens var. hirtella]
MATQTLCTISSFSIPGNKNSPPISLKKSAENVVSIPPQRARRKLSMQCSENQTQVLRTCKNCKTQFDPLLNHPRACRFHTAHFGGETKRKFESVYSGGTMDTPDSGKVYQYWHCCGSEDAFDPGCTAAPHSSYDD